jgi:hypothetical protein
MPSEDTFFRVKTGLRVGSDTVYADVLNQTVSVGKTTGEYLLDVAGNVRVEDDVLVENRVGVGTTTPTQRLDVIGTAVVSDAIGIGTTNPTQVFQVNSQASNAVVVTGIGSFGVGTVNPKQDFEFVGAGSSDYVVITGVGSVGIGTEYPVTGFQFKAKGSNSNVVINNYGYIGVNTLSPNYNVDINGNLRVVGYATITNEFVGISTIGFATITNAWVGVATIGFATITNEYVGVSTIGFATITNEYVGVSTIGFATITNAWVGVATIGIATIGREKVIVSEINELLVTGITTTALLDVGIGATLATFQNLGVTSVTSNENVFLKNIHPIVGIGTTLPTRTLDVAGDLRVRGEVLDSNNNVGYAYSVLGSQALGISGRFLDAANLLVRNKDYIAEEVVGFITSRYGPFGTNGVNFDYGFGPTGIQTGRAKCKRDVGLIVDAIAFDISRGGNSQSVGAGLSYNNGALQYLNDSPSIPSGLSAGYVKTAAVAGISTIASMARYIINNVQFPTSYQYGPYFGRFYDASNLIEVNKTFIAEIAVGRMLADNPSFVIPTGNQRCVDDVLLILDAIIYNLRYTGNDRVYDAAKFYIDNPTLLAGEETQSVEVYNWVADIATYVMRNEDAVLLLGGTYGTTRTQVYNNNLIIDGATNCANVASAISTFIAIITQAIIPGNLIGINRTPAISGITQLFDTTLAPDGDSNTNPNGCSNVVSAIYSCVGIVTTIIDGGPAVAPNVNYPAGQLTWQPPGPRIGNEWFVNKLGSDFNGGTGPGDAFLTIKKAASLAQPGDTIKVYAGLYVEDGPIKLNERVAVVGEDLRRTLVTTKDPTDLYYVKRGCYISQQSFVGPSNPGKAMVSFPTMGYGYADGTEENWQSPYVQNCTNFVPDSIGMRIDGSRAGGFKSMVLDAFTQYNQGGIGVSITNFGYAQLVSLFTICCDTAVYCDSGGVCDLNNSNSSFGNYGLVSNGATPLQYTGTVTTAPTGDNVDSLVINVGVGASQAFIDSVDLLRENKDFIASEAVGFITSTDGPFGIDGAYFDYGGSPIGRTICRRDSKIIVDALCSDILTLSNISSIEAGLAYRDSEDGSLTYLPETSPPPVGFSSGYVKDAELALVSYIAGISTYIVQNINVPVSYQSGVGSFAQYKDESKLYSLNIKPFITSRAGIITSIIGIGTQAVPERVLPKGQRPYDGQIAVIGTQYYFVSSIVIDDPGSGYDPTIPVEIVIDLPQDSDFFIPAEAAVFEDNINEDGSVGGVTILVSGTGYTETPPTVTIAAPPGAGTQATAHAVMEKYFFNPVSASTVSAGGTTTVTFDQFITYPVSVGTTVYFYQSSKIIASSITFEYIGTGINIVNAIPSKGAVPITDNQIVATNGGKVPFTSTDQGGNFRISEGITINQNTGTISGQAFSKSLQAEVTPLIIALQQ